MSLRTDIIFAKALLANTQLMEDLPAHNVHNTSIGLPDEGLDNAPLPYIVVHYDGMQNQNETKDDSYEGDVDVVQIGITVCAQTRYQLGELTETVRATIRQYFAEHQGDDTDVDNELIPDDMTISAGGVMYDPAKPCYWQELNYQCDTNP